MGIGSLIVIAWYLYFYSSLGVGMFPVKSGTYDEISWKLAARKVRKRCRNFLNQVALALDRLASDLKKNKDPNVL